MRHEGSSYDVNSLAQQELLQEEQQDGYLRPFHSSERPLQAIINRQSRLDLDTAFISTTRASKRITRTPDGLKFDPHGYNYTPVMSPFDVALEYASTSHHSRRQVEMEFDSPQTSTSSTTVSLVSTNTTISDFGVITVGGKGTRGRSRSIHEEEVISENNNTLGTSRSSFYLTTPAFIPAESKRSRLSSASSFRTPYIASTSAPTGSVAFSNLHMPADVDFRTSKLYLRTVAAQKSIDKERAKAAAKGKVWSEDVKAERRRDSMVGSAPATRPASRASSFMSVEANTGKRRTLGWFSSSSQSDSHLPLSHALRSSVSSMIISPSLLTTQSLSSRLRPSSSYVVSSSLSSPIESVSLPTSPQPIQSPLPTTTPPVVSKRRSAAELKSSPASPFLRPVRIRPVTTISSLGEELTRATSGTDATEVLYNHSGARPGSRSASRQGKVHANEENTESSRPASPPPPALLPSPQLLSSLSIENMRERVVSSSSLQHLPSTTTSTFTPEAASNDSTGSHYASALSSPLRSRNLSPNPTSARHSHDSSSLTTPINVHTVSGERLNGRGGGGGGIPIKATKSVINLFALWGKKDKKKSSSTEHTFEVSSVRRGNAEAMVEINNESVSSRRTFRKRDKTLPASPPLPALPQPSSSPAPAISDILSFPTERVDQVPVRARRASLFQRLNWKKSQATVGIPVVPSLPVYYSSMPLSSPPVSPLRR